MPEPSGWRFEPFRLDAQDERLWRGETVVRLNYKAFAVLQCLVRQAGQLVTKEDLFEAVWPETAVSESVLTNSIRELRQALCDRTRTPVFIQTVYGRGYRFIAAVTPVTEEDQVGGLNASDRVPLAMSDPTSLFVGREDEQDQLHQWYRSACRGRRQLIWITGEAGIGKTALVELTSDRVLRCCF